MVLKRPNWLYRAAWTATVLSAVLFFILVELAFAMASGQSVLLGSFVILLLVVSILSNLALWVCWFVMK